MRLFARIAALGSMSAAGREFGLSAGAVSHRLKALETKYGAPLLTRSTRAISLTREGRIFLESSAKIILETEALDATLSATPDAPLKGPLRISAPSDLGRNVVAPLLLDFKSAHPSVTPELYLVDDVADLVAGEFDVAFRFGKLESSALVSRLLAANSRCLVASPDYLARHGDPQHPKQLEDHRCLVLVRNGERMPWTLNDGGRRITIRVEPTLSTTDGELLRHWAASGLGIAFKSRIDVARDLDSGRLREVLPAYADHNVSLNLIFPSARAAVPRVRAFIDLVASRFRQFPGRAEEKLE